MPARTVILLVVLIVIGVFAAVNWQAIVAPTTVSLVVTDVQAPIGLIMLGITVLVTVLFLLFVVYLQTSVLLDTRRHTRELQGQRELADKAEASRFTELRAFLEAELRRLGERSAETQASLAARVDQVQLDLRATIQQTENSLSAYIGELDDRVHRAGSARDPHPPA
jgi:hypothetical protein